MNNKNRELGNTEVDSSDKPSPNIQCEVCGSKYTYTTQNQKICRKCGHREHINKEDKEAKQ